MHYLLIYDAAPDYMQRRGEFREEHLRLAWDSVGAGELVLGGALESGEQAYLLFEGPSAEAASRFAEADPYVRHGLVARWRVERWNTVAGERAASPVMPSDRAVLERAAMPSTDPTQPELRVGHVHLKVADLERAIGFYRDVLGLEVTGRMGNAAAFLSSGGYHHHLGLNTWESAGGTPPPPGSTGLFHVAFLYPTRRQLAVALRRVLASGIDLDGAADHGVSEALYLHDPDMNGLELYCDRPSADWPRAADGSIAMVTRRLDLDALLATLEQPE